MPPEKVGELLNDLWAFAGKLQSQAKLNGRKEMLAGTSELFEKIVEVKRKEIGMMDHETARLKSYFNWEREFEKPKEK